MKERPDETMPRAAGRHRPGHSIDKVLVSVERNRRM